MIARELALYRTQTIRELEHHAMQALSLSSEDLMQRAGRAAFETLTPYLKTPGKLAVYCGGGNNGGDGLVLAQLAFQAGYQVILHTLTPLDSTLPTRPLESPMDEDTDWVIDALVGIGLEGEVRDEIKTAILLINASQKPVLAIDIPSGLEADTGCSLGACVKARATITFLGRKQGMMTLDGPDHCGTITCDDLGLGETPAIQPDAYLLEAVEPLPNRLKNSHKGLFGHTLIVGGAPGMPGAVSLAAEAALRVGAGAVTVATHPDHADQMISGLPEAMLFSIEDTASLSLLLERITVCVIGPGLGEDSWAQSVFDCVMKWSGLKVVDASALRLLASAGLRGSNWILTPHPGEAASLLHTTTHAIQADRFKTLNDLKANYGGSVLLKGVGTLLESDSDIPWVCAGGNPGMSSAGMGDVLSGVLGGLLAQGLPVEHALKYGVWLHAKAADEAARALGERGLLARDLMPYLHQLVNR